MISWVFGTISTILIYDGINTFDKKWLTASEILSITASTHCRNNVCPLLLELTLCFLRFVCTTFMQWLHEFFKKYTIVVSWIRLSVVNVMNWFEAPGLGAKRTDRCRCCSFSSRRRPRCAATVTCATVVTTTQPPRLHGGHFNYFS